VIYLGGVVKGGGAVFYLRGLIGGSAERVSGCVGGWVSGCGPGGWWGVMRTSLVTANCLTSKE
jgi:hypothetical protein